MAHVFWRTKDGGKVRIAEMSNQHLMHAVRMLQRKHKEIITKRFVFDMLRRGHSRVMTEDMQCISTPAKIWPVYRSLAQEARRRNLEV